MVHGPVDPWLQLAIFITQLAIPRISAHTAIWSTFNNRRTRDPEMENLDPPQHQPPLQTDLVEVQQELAFLG